MQRTNRFFGGDGGLTIDAATTSRDQIAPAGNSAIISFSSGSNERPVGSGGVTPLSPNQSQGAESVVDTGVYVGTTGTAASEIEELCSWLIGLGLDSSTVGTVRAEKAKFSDLRMFSPTVCKELYGLTQTEYLRVQAALATKYEEEEYY